MKILMFSTDLMKYIWYSPQKSKYHLYIFISDLLVFIGDVTRSVDLYADDTVLYENGLDRDMLENNRQHALN